MQDTFVQNEANIDRLTSQYNERYLNKCLVAADILSANPELQTREELAELSRRMDVEFMVLFDRYGRETVLDSSYVNFQVSKDPNNQSYVFGKLLQGLEYVIQEPMPDEISGQYHQYIGSLMFDLEGNTDGFLQIAVYPDKMEEALAATELPVVLSGVKAGGTGFAFAVDKEAKEFSWHPESRLIGKEQKIEIVQDEEAAASMAREGAMMDVKMPDGRVRKPESAASRWAGIAI